MLLSGGNQSAITMRHHVAGINPEIGYADRPIGGNQPTNLLGNPVKEFTRKDDMQPIDKNLPIKTIRSRAAKINLQRRYAIKRLQSVQKTSIQPGPGNKSAILSRNELTGIYPLICVAIQ